MTRAEADQAASYQPSQVVTFRKGGRGKPRPGIGYREDQVDADASSVRLTGPKDKAIDWQPVRRGADQASSRSTPKAPASRSRRTKILVRYST